MALLTGSSGIGVQAEVSNDNPQGSTAPLNIHCVAQDIEECGKEFSKSAFNISSFKGGDVVGQN